MWVNWLPESDLTHWANSTFFLALAKGKLGKWRDQKYDVQRKKVHKIKVTC